MTVSYSAERVLVYQLQIYFHSVDAGGKVRRSRIRHYDRRSDVDKVCRKQAGSHYLTVYLDILAEFAVPGLYELLCDDFEIVGRYFVGEPTGCIAFAGIGVGTGNE